MEREEASRMPNLSEDLVEKVLGMVPFPYILKARALSKSWRARLSPVSSEDGDQETSRVAISFQRRMSEYWTAKWTFCPILFDEEDLIAYDPASHRFEWIPLSSFLPENCIKSKFQRLEGALLISLASPDRCDLFVTNIVTRTSRLLPPRPLVQQQYSCFKITLVTHKETYKVIALYNNEHGLSHALIYDSNINDWSRRTVEVPRGFKAHTHGVHLNGVVYWLVGPKEDTRGLLLFTVEEETFVFVEMPWTDVSSCLKICAGSLLMANKCMNEGRLCVTLKGVDIESRSWLELTRGPPKAACVCHLTQILHTVIDRDCLFFSLRKCRDDKTHNARILVYNVQNDQWSYFTLPPEVDTSWGFMSCFHPGLNPFMQP